MIDLATYGKAKGIKTRTPYEIRSHVAEICKYFMLAMAGALPDGKRNLAITIPPRHSKSMTANNFIEMAMGLLPDCEFILVSYAKELAVRNAVSIRNTMYQDWYKDMFPHCRIDPKTASRMDNFATTEGGKVYASGNDGTITGFGAGKTRKGFGGAIVIDDPIKPKDAKSETMRQSVIDFYNGTLKSRRNSDHTPIILIMQRVHQEDLVGYITKTEPEDWYVLDIPAYDEQTDTVLWPERVSKKDLMKLKEFDPFTYYSQYQQRPIIPGGSIVKEEWWNFYDDLEEVVKRCSFIGIFGDTACKDTDSSDYSVFQTWGFEGSKHAYLLDQHRGKWIYPDLVKNAQIMWDKWQGHPLGNDARLMFVEDKSSGIGLVQTLNNLDIPTEGWKPGDYDAPDNKVAKAKEASFMIFGGKVWLPNPDTISSAAWVDNEYLPEWAAFSEDMSHKHDDQVDPTAMALLTWKDMGGGFDRE